MNLVYEASEKIDKQFAAYSVTKSKIERQLAKMIGYEMEKILREKYPENNFTIEYDHSNRNLKRIDLVVRKEDNYEAIFEIKQYYSFDAIRDNWSRGKVKPINKDIRKLDNIPKIENKFILVILGHYHKMQAPEGFAYSSVHNRNVRSSGDELLIQAKTNLESFFKVNELPNKIWDISLDSIEQTSVHLIIGIGQVEY